MTLLNFLLNLPYPRVNYTSYCWKSAGLLVICVKYQYDFGVSLWLLEVEDSDHAIVTLKCGSEF